MVRYQTNMIHGSMAECIVEGIHRPPLREYLRDKFGRTDKVFEYIDWNSMSTCVNNLEGTRATNVIKLVMNWQNNNHQNELFYSKTGMCPACANVKEDHLHFLCCKEPVLHRLNTKATSKFHLELQKTRTVGIISNIFKAPLQALRTGNESM